MIEEFRNDILYIELITEKKDNLKMKRRKRYKLRIGENEKIVLIAIGTGLLVIGTMIFPTLPMAVQPILKMRGQKGLLKLVENLRKKNLIILSGEKIRLTRRGKEILQNKALSEIQIQRPKKWDGLWRLASYDIPKKYNRERDWFRGHLKRLDFYQIQASLWAYPYSCKEEIAILAKGLNITDYIIVMETDYLPNQDELENFYDL